MSESSNRPGCLAFLFGLARPESASPPDSAGETDFQFRIRDDFLSPAENSFYRVLKLAIADQYVICPKVSLADVFFLPERGIAAWNRINRKHIDFLLCDPNTMKPVTGIELDDSTHQRPDRRQRDQLLHRVFDSASLPLVRIPVQAAYDAEELRRLVQSIKPRPDATLLTGEPKPATESAPICPNCGVQMILRTASRGKNEGQSFYGCPNYPKCRQIRPLD